MDKINIVRQFYEGGEIKSIVPFGSGHINDTYRVTIEENGETHNYVLQRMNTNVFPDPEMLTNNATKATHFIRKKLRARGEDPEHGTIRFYPAKNGKYFIYDDKGLCWRFENLIDHTVCYDLATSPEMFEATGVAFGQFMADLADFPADQLGEVIPNFHHTGIRFETFHKAVEENLSGRKNTCEKEIAFALEREELAWSLVKKLQSGEIPVRVTHNDTKINNILMDEKTNLPVCIIDLDTIMPGAAAYDFGDSIRFGASNAAEDEKDLSKVFMRLDLFEAYARGYLRTVGKKLSEAEARSLALGAIVITYETGIRFLGDYLNGDTYFKTAYPEHNLVRARTQLKLVEDMEAKKSEMLAIVEKYWKEAQEN